MKKPLRPSAVRCVWCVVVWVVLVCCIGCGDDGGGDANPSTSNNATTNADTTGQTTTGTNNATTSPNGQTTTNGATTGTVGCAGQCMLGALRCGAGAPETCVEDAITGCPVWAAGAACAAGTFCAEVGEAGAVETLCLGACADAPECEDRVEARCTPEGDIGACAPRARACLEFVRSPCADDARCVDDGDGALACADAAELTPAQAQRVELGAFVVELDPARAAFVVEDTDGRVLLESVGREAIEAEASEDRLGGYAPGAFRHMQLGAEMVAGAFRFTRGSQPWQRWTVFTAVEHDADAQTLTVTIDGARPEPGRLRFGLDARGNLDVALDAPPAPDGFEPLTSVAFRCDPGERFYGLGSQVYATDHRGWRVPIWTREQGIGKLEDPFFGLNGALEDAYAPMGWVMSSRRSGVLLGRSERSVIELCSERDDAWRIETFAEQVRFTLMAGRDYKDLLTQLTDITGRIEPPVPWTFAPWNDGLRSPERVRGVARTLRDNGIPSSAMWVEDWIGGEDEPLTGYHLEYVWYADYGRYPDLPDMIAELHDDGFKFLGYFNPFVRVESDMWPEATEGDFVIRTPDGDPYVFTDPIFKQASMVDLTHPGAVDWLRGYQLEAIALGMDGWMADYGEWLPYDAVLHDGRTGREVHNLYPLMWHQANGDHLREGHPDGDFSFFVRSGFGWTGGGTSGVAPVVWAGDQNTSWDAGDGIKTVVPIGLNLGMCGVGVFAHDVAGYASAITPPSSRELFWRWTELGAFSPVMRTHHGAVDEENWAFDEDAGTLEHWKRYAIVHTRLYPYLMALAHEASERGWPMLRHPVLEFPDDTGSEAVVGAFMLGDALWVAPVLDEGADSVEVRLPPGRWASFWDGAALDGPGPHTVSAPLGTIPVFLRPGAVVPLLPSAPDTLASADSDAVTTLDDIGPDLHLRVHPGAASSRALADGTVLALSGEPMPAGGVGADAVRIDGAPAPVCASDDDAGCVEPEPGVLGGVVVRVQAAEGAAVAVSIDGGPTLTLTGAARAYRVSWTASP